MLEFRQVTRRYGAITAVRNISFAAEAGEIVGYLGPNGSGKSTTVRMLAGLISPSSGTIHLDGSDIQDDLNAYKTRIGYVPEEAHLYTHLTASEYLRLCGRLRGLDPRLLEDKIEACLRTFELDRDRHAMMASFSKGMRQKVLLSAALLHDPRILILDEPASGLDLTTSLLLREIVRGVAARGRIVFYSSHELDTVERISTRVMVLRSGEIVAQDSAARLRALMDSPSLEDVYAQLTASDDVATRAATFLDAVHLPQAAG